MAAVCRDADQGNAMPGEDARRLQALERVDTDQNGVRPRARP
jgi:hypothetical protein